ncbi:hypothetical protein CUMW_027540 [Citrus unshiu]|nr:hypothetical protein CUMW_027540 [Citrus unshiu]
MIFIFNLLSHNIEWMVSLAIDMSSHLSTPGWMVLPLSKLMRLQHASWGLIWSSMVVLIFFRYCFLRCFLY